jgi:ribA/ribD-fused uncharacterized protein
MYEGVEYPTAEHAYQAAKVSSHNIKINIRDCPTPSAAKEYFDTYTIDPDPGWTLEKKLAIMEEILLIKFGGKEPLLTRALLATGDANIIEGNNWNDGFWGVCNGVGENHLGRILVKIREALNHQKQNIIFQLAKSPNNDAVAKSLSITPRELYEKMIAFNIQNKEYWIS